jgi:hypothetical protein
VRRPDAPLGAPHRHHRLRAPGAWEIHEGQLRRTRKALSGLSVLTPQLAATAKAALEVACAGETLSAWGGSRTPATGRSGAGDGRQG